MPTAFLILGSLPFFRVRVARDCCSWAPRAGQTIFKLLCAASTLRRPPPKNVAEGAPYSHHHNVSHSQPSVHGNDLASARIFCSHRGTLPHPRPHFVTPIRCLYPCSHSQGLVDCPQIIVADGANIVEKSELKRGKVSASLAARYSQYLQHLADALEAEAAQLQVQVPPTLNTFDSP